MIKFLFLILLLNKEELVNYVNQAVLKHLKGACQREKDTRQRKMQKLNIKPGQSITNIEIRSRQGDESREPNDTDVEETDDPLPTHENSNIESDLEMSEGSIEEENNHTFLPIKKLPKDLKANWIGVEYKGKKFTKR